MMDGKAMVLLLGMVEAFWPRHFKNGPTKVRAWLKACGDLDVGDMEAAILLHAKTEQWPPTVAEVREAVRKVHAPEQLSPAEAWEMALVAVRDRHHLEAPQVYDPLVNRTMGAVGWEAIEDQQSRTIVRAQFLKLYEDFASVETREDRVRFNDGPRLGGGSSIQALGDGVRKEIEP